MTVTTLSAVRDGARLPDVQGAAQTLGQNDCFQHMIAPLDKRGSEVFVAATEDTALMREQLVTLGHVHRVTVTLAEVLPADDIRERVREAFAHSSVRVALGANDDGPGISLLRSIVDDALKRHCTDIHCEPTREGGRIRFRIDRSLVEICTVSEPTFRSLMGVLKVQSQMKVDSQRILQDGSFEKVLASGQTVDVRVNIVPLSTVKSEKAVLRLLGSAAALRRFADLGLPQRMADQYRFLIETNNCLHLVAGPTNSGKTSTVFAVVSEADESQNVLTVEDPVEIRLPHAYQVTVSPANDVTFANAMRAFLRDDPDIIVCGETRDAETAEVCALAGLAGRQTWSTIHAPDAIRAVQRLIEFGVSPSTLAQSLKTVLAQRLIRKLCPRCRVVDEAVSHTFRRLYVQPYEEEHSTKVGALYRRPTPEERKKHGGCGVCGGTGISGQVAAFELFVVTPDIEDAIVQRQSRAALYRLARENDYVPLRYHAADLIIQGLTSIQEVRKQHINLEVDGSS